jgi:hypothetical protein
MRREAAVIDVGWVVDIVNSIETPIRSPDDVRLVPGVALGLDENLGLMDNARRPPEGLIS